WEQTVAALPFAIKRILAFAFKIIPISPRKCVYFSIHLGNSFN
ncbi:hypothetical protein Goshw_011916, partial [Gossypium schwendimanii]|nr:hypothetical protein [Gossypium schwendimanii]